MSQERKRATKKKALAPRPAADREERVVAVTGAYSFIGAELLKELERDRHYYKLLAVDLRKPRFPASKTQFHKVDLTLPTADSELAALFRREAVDTVVHAAFLSTPTHADAWAHELESIGTMHVLNAAAEAKVRRLVLWSQTLVYGAHPENPNYLTEEHELRGQLSGSRYVRDKVEVERQAQRFAKENPEVIVTILRTATTLGPTIRNFATRFFSRPVAPVMMGFDPLMQLVHERDVVSAFARALAEEQAGAFNIVGDGVLPYSTLLAMMGRLPLPLPRFVAYPLSSALWATQLFGSPPHFLDFLRFLCVADGSRAKKVLGWQPRHNIRAIVQDFLGVAGSSVAPTAIPTQGAA